MGDGRWVLGMEVASLDPCVGAGFMVFQMLGFFFVDFFVLVKIACFFRIEGGKRKNAGREL